MTVAETYKFQLSMKYGPGGVGMLNVRADTAEEFVTNVEAAVASVGGAAVLMDAYNTEFQAVSNLANGGFEVNQQQGQQQNRSGSSGEICQHGPMTYKEGSSSKGPWKGWFCSLDKNNPNKCQPKFLK